MTDEMPKPNRNRRRWIIAGVLLVFITVTGWWYWPRGDARFVGKWQLNYESPKSTGGTLWLYSNGMAHFTLKGNRISASSSWSVNDRQFCIGRRETRNSQHPIRVINNWIYSVTRHHMRPQGEEFEIIAIEPARVSLRCVVDGDRAVMSRLPE